MALGLVSSEITDDYWMNNARRRIFYDNPNGPMTITGLMSMAKTDSTPYPEFKWEEKRYRGITTTTIAGPTSGVVFYLPGTETTSGSPTTTVAGNLIRIYVADASDFRVNTNAMIYGLDLTSSTGDLTGVVETRNTDGTDYIEIRVSDALASTILNTASANVGKYVMSLGTAFAEGSKTGFGRVLFPYEPENYTQIHKTAFAVTGTAAKEPLKFDKNGVWPDLLKQNGMDHLAGLEWNLFFGRKSKKVEANPKTGQPVTKRTAAGIRQFLDYYEQGTNYGLPDISAQTDWRTYTRKRVIKLGGAVITSADWDEINSRMFEKVYTSDGSKIIVGGSGFIAKFAAFYKGQTQTMNMADEGFEKFNLKFNTVETNGGTLYFKQHSLFNDPSLPIMRNSGFVIDIGCLFWRPLTDRDTDVMPNIQDNDEDIRMDQFITEGGPEIRFAESMMYIESLGGISK